MPTRLTIEARLVETAQGLTAQQMSDHRDNAVTRLLDDLSYSTEVGGRGVTVNREFAAKLIGDRAVTGSDDRFQIDVSLPDELFPVHVGGLQHLVGILAGDVLPTATDTIRWQDATIKDFELSEGLRNEAIGRFRTGTAHSIHEIRKAFKLPPNRPLLAFSFKPRVGVPLVDVQQVAGDLAQAGFNIVEFDTRRLDDPETNLDAWVQIQETMTKRADGRPVAFSPNLSLRTDIALNTAQEWCKRTKGTPTTLKVDGGLDGLSTIQAIRAEIKENRPIITCYPSMRKSLGMYLGRPDDWDDWVELLAISGADIIYPGGRPSFRDDRGRLVAGEKLEKSVKQAQARYRKYIEEGWPMPSYAAGPHAGDLHVALHLLGGSTAMFLGDALAASRRGTVEAGRFIAQLVDETAAQFTSTRSGTIPSLSDPILLAYRDHYSDDTFVKYADIFGVDKATPWWQR